MTDLLRGEDCRKTESAHAAAAPVGAVAGESGNDRASSSIAKPRLRVNDCIDAVWRTAAEKLSRGRGV